VFDNDRFCQLARIVEDWRRWKGWGRETKGGEIFNEKSRSFFPSLLSLFFFLLFLVFLLHVKDTPLSEPSLII
jgi:hypothetical protein